MSNVPKYLRHAYSVLPPEQHHVALSVSDNGQHAAANVIVGDAMRVRLDRNRVVTGKVVSAKVYRLRITNTRIQAVFEVVLECGIAKVHKTVFVKRIPSLTALGR